MQVRFPKTVPKQGPRNRFQAKFQAGTSLAGTSSQASVPRKSWFPSKISRSKCSQGNLLENLFLATLLETLFLGTLLGNALGNLTCEPVLGNLVWAPVPGNLWLGTLLGNLFLKHCLGTSLLGTLLGHLFLETSSWKHLLENLFWEISFVWEKHVPGNLAGEMLPGNLENSY